MQRQPNKLTLNIFPFFIHVFMAGVLLSACTKAFYPDNSNNNQFFEEKDVEATFQSNNLENEGETIPVHHLFEEASLGKGYLPQVTYTPLHENAITWDGVNLSIYSYGSRNKISDVELEQNGMILGIEGITPDGQYVILGRNYSQMFVNLKSLQIIYPGRDPVYIGDLALEDNLISDTLIYSPNKKYAVAVLRDVYSNHATEHALCRIDLSYSQNLFNFCFPTTSTNDWWAENPMSEPAISPDSTMVAIGYRDNLRNENILYIWNLTTGAIIHEIKDQPYRYSKVDFSPDGKFLVAQGESILYLWNPKSGQLIKKLTGFPDVPITFSFSENGKEIIVYFETHLPQSINLDTNRIETITKTEDSNYPFDRFEMFLLDEGYLAQSNYHFRPQSSLLSSTNSTNPQHWGVKENKRPSMAFSPDGSHYAIADGSIQIWDVDTHELINAIYLEHPLSIINLIYHPNGEDIAAITETGQVYIWNVDSGKLTFQTSTIINEVLTVGNMSADEISDKDEIAPTYSIAFTANGQYIATSNGSKIELWNVETNQFTYTFDKQELENNIIKLSFSIENPYLFGVTEDLSAIVVWDYSDGKIIDEINTNIISDTNQPITDIQANQFATIAKDNGFQSIRLINLDNKQTDEIPIERTQITKMKLSANGQFLIIQNDIDQIYVINTATKEVLMKSNEPISVYDFAISSDGAHVGTTETDYGFTLVSKLWNIEKSLNTAPINVEQHDTPDEETDANSTTNNVDDQKVKDDLVFELSDPPAYQQIGLGQINAIHWTQSNKYLDVISPEGLLTIGSFKLSYDGKDTSVFHPENLYIDGAYFSPIVNINDYQYMPLSSKAILWGKTTDHSIQIWDTATRTMVAQFPPLLRENFYYSNEEEITATDKMFIFNNKENGYTAWDLNNSQFGLTYSSGTYGSHSQSNPIISPDQQILALTDRENFITLWDVSTGLILNELGADSEPISDLAFSLDSQLIVGAAGGSAWIWPTNINNLPIRIQLYESIYVENEERTHFDNTVTSVAINKDDTLLVVCTSEKDMYLYSAITGKLIYKIMRTDAVINQLYFSPHRDELLAVDVNGILSKIDIDSREIKRTTDIFTSRVNQLTTLNDGSIAVTRENLLQILNPQSGEITSQVFIPADKILAVSPAADKIAAYHPYQVSIYDFTTGEKITTLPEEAVPFEPEFYYWDDYIEQKYFGADFNNDGTRLMTFGNGGFWLYENEKLVSHLDGHKPYTTQGEISSSGDWVVASQHEYVGYEPEAYLFETANTCTEFTQTDRFETNLTRFAISKNEQWVAIVESEWESDADAFTYYIKLYNSETGKQEYKKQLPDLVNSQVAFSPDNLMLAVGQQDGIIHLLSLPELEIISSFQAYPDAISAITFSQDSAQLITSNEQGIIRIWAVQ